MNFLFKSRLLLTQLLCVSLSALWLSACATDQSDQPAVLPTAAVPVMTATATTSVPTLAPGIVTILPPATAAPAVEATPQSHSVGDGETLLGIAIQYGLGVDQLIAANSDVNPRFLSVGQTLTIPLANETGDPIFIAEPTPLALSLRPAHCLTSATDRRPCIGLIENQTDAPASNLGVQYAVPGLDPQLAYPELDVVFPGQLLPYVFDVPQAAEAVNVVLSSAVLAGTANERYTQLEIAPSQLTDLEETALVVSSAITNPDLAAATQVRVALVALNQLGQPLGYRLLELPEIAPGTTVPLSAVLTVNPALVTEVIITAQAVRSGS